MSVRSQLMSVRGQLMSVRSQLTSAEGTSVMERVRFIFLPFRDVLISSLLVWSWSHFGPGFPVSDLWFLPRPPQCQGATVPG